MFDIGETVNCISTFLEPFIIKGQNYILEDVKGLFVVVNGYKCCGCNFERIKIGGLNNDSYRGEV